MSAATDTLFRFKLNSKKQGAGTRAETVNINHKNRDSEKRRANVLSVSVQSDKDI